MQPDDVVLVRLERAGLVEHGVGHLDLAHVVQACGELELEHRCRLEVEQRADAPCQLDDVLRVLCRALVAHVHRGGESVDLRVDGGIEVLVPVTMLERGAGELRQLGEDLEVVGVEVRAAARHGGAEHARDGVADLDRHRGARPPALVLGHGAVHEVAVVREQRGPSAS